MQEQDTLVTNTSWHEQFRKILQSHYFLLLMSLLTIFPIVNVKEPCGSMPASSGQWMDNTLTHTRIKFLRIQTVNVYSVCCLYVKYILYIGRT